MRILIVNKFARVTGGADRHCLDLTAALRDAGHEVAWLSTTSPGNAERRGAFVPAAVTAADRDALGPFAAARAARRSLWNTTAAAAAARLLEDLAPDVVHLHKLYPQLSAAPAVLAARRGVRVVQTLHDYEFISADPRGIGGAGRRSDRALSAALLRVRRRRHVPAIDAFLAGSDHVADAYARAGLRAAVLPLPTAVPPGPVPPFAERRGAVFAGRLAPEKGIGDVLELARRAPALPVTVAGDGPLAGLARVRSGELANLTVLGPVSPTKVTRLLRGARVAVVPSRWAEPAGLTALEAMAVGTPVLAYDAGGLGETVARSGGGVLVPAEPAALAGACAKLAADEAMWAPLSAAGRGYVAREHAPAAYVERLLGVYRGEAG